MTLTDTGPLVALLDKRVFNISSNRLRASTISANAPPHSKD